METVKLVIQFDNFDKDWFSSKMKQIHDDYIYEIKPNIILQALKEYEQQICLSILLD